MVVSREIFPLAGITTTDVENFPDYPRLREHYQDGLSTILSNNNDKTDLIATILDPNYSKMLPFIVANELFPESKDVISRTIHFKETLPPLTLIISNSLITALTSEEISEVIFDQEDKEWKLKHFHSLWTAFRKIEREIQQPETYLLGNAYENFLISNYSEMNTGHIPLSFYLVNDFLVQTFPSTPIIDPKIRTASHAILGSSKVLGPSINPTTRSEAFQYLRNFVSFANDRYPGFAEIPQLRAILETENQIQIPLDPNPNPRTDGPEVPRASQSSSTNISSRTATQTPTTNGQENSESLRIKILSLYRAKSYNLNLRKNHGQLIAQICQRLNKTEDELYAIANIKGPNTDYLDRLWSLMSNELTESDISSVKESFLSSEVANRFKGVLFIKWLYPDKDPSLFATMTLSSGSTCLLSFAKDYVLLESGLQKTKFGISGKH